MVCVIAALTAGTAAGAVPARAARSDWPVSHGPWINRILIGGAERDLSIEELRAVNLARGIVLPR
jgi:hypothetical protein